MKRLLERGEAIGRQAQQRKIEELAELLHDAMPDALVESGGGGVVLSGQRLLRRWLNEASLRFITGLMR